MTGFQFKIVSAVLVLVIVTAGVSELIDWIDRRRKDRARVRARINARENALRNSLRVTPVIPLKPTRKDENE